MIEIVHLEKKYENVTPLKDVNVTINDGDVISIIGPSGTGKSTLIRCINLLERPTNGQILFDGQDITAKDYDVSKARRRMGMVFQSFNLFPHLTVLENIMKPQIQLLKRNPKEAYEKAKGLLKDVDLEDKMLNYPDELSGGQKQRIAICRTLAMDPEIILFDEPTSALDPTMIGEVEAVIRRLAMSNHTMMIVTHEMKFAKEICNRVFYMDEGGIYEEGTPEEIFEHPRKEKTRRFIRRLKVLELEINSEEFDFGELTRRIEEYCDKNKMSNSLKYRIKSVFEELCVQIILPELSKPQIFAAIEYSDENLEASMDVRYNGPEYDPRNSDNALSLKIIERRSSSIEYKKIAEDEYHNRVIIRFQD